MTIPQATNDQLVRLIEAIVDDRLRDLHTVQPAKILAFDSTAQTVDVRLQVRRTLADGTLEDPPQLYGLPVAWPRGGGFYLSFPLAAGDFVLVVCSELPTLAWRNSGSLSNPVLDERHTYNGAFALPMGYPDSEKVEGADVDTDNLVIGHEGGAKVTVKPNGEIEAGASGATFEFVAHAAKTDARLSDIQSAFDSHIHTTTAVTGGGGSPGVIAPTSSPIGSLPSVAASKTKAE